MIPTPPNKTMLVLMAGIMLAVGLLLLAFMIVVEDEPGALPLLVTAVGTVWLFTLYRSR